MTVELINYTPHPVSTIEESAAICYDSKPSWTGRIMDTCYDSLHHSVLEHVSFTFHVEGVSRSLLAQLSRHRLISLTVRSQRYCVEDDARWVIPDSIMRSTKALSEYLDLRSIVNEKYKALVGYGIPPEDARYALANATETTLNITLNLRSLIHLANERLCNRAQWEIRKMVSKMCELVSGVEPKFRRYLVPKCEVHTEHPFCTEKKSCGRHQRLVDVFTSSTPASTTLSGARSIGAKS